MPFNKLYFLMLQKALKFISGLKTKSCSYLPASFSMKSMGKRRKEEKGKEGKEKKEKEKKKEANCIY